MALRSMSLRPDTGVAVADDNGHRPSSVDLRRRQQARAHAPQTSVDFSAFSDAANLDAIIGLAGEPHQPWVSVPPRLCRRLLLVLAAVHPHHPRRT
jgi:hypothetical protein